MATTSLEMEENTSAPESEALMRLIVDPEIKIRYDKIAKVFGDRLKDSEAKEADEPDNNTKTESTKGMISMKRMEFVLKCLVRTGNPFHTFMNVISVNECSSGAANSKKTTADMIEELNNIPRNNTEFMTYQEFIQFTSQATAAETGTPKENLLKHINLIADARKVFYTWKLLLFIFFALGLVIVHAMNECSVRQAVGMVKSTVDECSSDTEFKHQLRFDVKKTNEAWRYYTYSLVHKNWEHLLINLGMFVVLTFSLHSQGKSSFAGFCWVFLLYTVGVVSGSLAYYIFDSSSLLGCSGGVYCLVGAYFPSMILNWSEEEVVLVKYAKKRAPLAYTGRMLQIIKLVTISLIALFEFGSAAWRRYHHCDAGISVVTHVFGFLAGVTMGFNFLLDEKEKPWERKVKFICCALFFLAFGAALSLNIVGSRSGVGFWDEIWDKHIKPENMLNTC